MFKNQTQHDPIHVLGRSLLAGVILAGAVIGLTVPFALAQETAAPEETEVGVGMTIADLELLAKLPSDKRKKMLDLLQKAGISTIATDEVITAAINNLPVSEESGFILEDEDGNEIATEAVETATATPKTTPEPTGSTLEVVETNPTENPVETAALTSDPAKEPTAATPEHPPAPIPGNLDLGVQALLKEVGCYRGAVDGIWGKGSRASVSRYFIHKGIVRDSLEATEDLYQLLSAETGTVCKRVVAKTGSGRKTAPAKEPTAATPTIKPKFGSGVFR